MGVHETTDGRVKWVLVEHPDRYGNPRKRTDTGPTGEWIRGGGKGVDYG